jgi:hypothetical protein
LITAFRTTTLLSFSLVCTSIAFPSSAAAQATPAATQPIHLSAFGAIAGTYTGLEDSRNLSITAGADIGFKPFYRFYPSAEFRGTYPIDNGAVAGEKSILFGIKLERLYHQFHPYGDVLYGRNKIEYQDGGYPNANGTLLYVESVASVISFGGGVDIDLTPHFAAKFDGQFQRIDTPVTDSGYIYAKAFSAGIVYRLDFNHHFHYDRRTGQVTNLPKDRTPPPPKTPPPGAPTGQPTDPNAPPTSDATATTPPPDASAPPAPAPDPATSTPASAPAPIPAPTSQPQ